MGMSFFILIAILLLIGVPIFITLGLSVFTALLVEGRVPLTLVVQRMFSGLDRFPLMAIPFFILAGSLMASGGLSRRLLHLANLLVGWMKGGLGMSTVSGTLFFSAISGSSPATVVAVGKLMLPALLAKGYPRAFSIGLIMSCGSLGIIIPPSIFMIVYGAVMGVSIGALFMAGIGAGLVYALAFLVYCRAYAWWRGMHTDPYPSLAEVGRAALDAIWGLAIPFIILGGIYGGIFTPTEAAAVAVVYSAFVTLVIYREMSLREFARTLVDSATITAQIMIILSVAAAFAWYLTTTGIPRDIAALVLTLTDNQILVLLLINVTVLIAGMFLDPNSIIIILAPLVATIAIEVGVHPVHIGVILAVNAAIGMFTPPLGLNLFVASSLDNVTYGDAVRGSAPFVGIALVALLAVTFIPAISLWLPRLVYAGL